VREHVQVMITKCLQKYNHYSCKYECI